MRNERIAVYGGTRNMYEVIPASIKSMLMHTYVDKVYLLIEDDEFPEYLPDCVETINVRNQQYFPEGCINRYTFLTYMVLLRAAYHRMFPQHDKVLSIDIDTFVEQDVSDLWDIDLGDNYFGMAFEPHCSKGGMHYKRDRYFNFGVSLMNLKKLRDGMGDTVIKALNERQFAFMEQDAFNEYCEGKILEIPSDYNACEWTSPTNNKKIIHYAGIRKWNTEPYYLKYRDIPWHEVERERSKLK